MGSQGGGNLPPLQPNGGTLNHAYKSTINWSNISYQSHENSKHHQRSISAGYLQRSNDDMIDPQSKKRTGLHRRSASDSLTFIETGPDSFGDGFDWRHDPFMTKDFDRFDEEQLMSIFAGIEPFQEAQKQAGMSDSVASLSDHNSSMNGPAMEDSSKLNVGSQVRSEPEVQSACNGDKENGVPGRTDCSNNSASPADSNMDPKRIKRIIANRQSAQRSRIRKLLYISELERSVTALQAEVATISPQVAFLDHQRTVLNMDNSALKERIAALERDKVFKDAHSEALKKELQRLRKIYQQQQMHCKQPGTEQEIPSNGAFDLKQH